VDLTLADYTALSKGDRSGLAVALSNRADATLRKLTPAQDEIAHRIMLRLIHFGEGRSDTRRQQPRSKLRAVDENGADFDAVLQRLTADRLLTMDDREDSNDPRVDLAHEVMITAWPTLERWVKTRRLDELQRRRFETAAAHWNERGRGAGGLLDRIVLAEVEAWRRTESARELGESADLADLVTASKATHQRTRRYVIGSIAVLAVAAALAVVKWRGEKQAIEERKRQEHQSNRQLASSYQEAGRQLLLDGHPLKALPYLVEARKHGETDEALQILYWAATRYFLVVRPLEHLAEVASAAFSPDGTRIVTASDDKTARIWNASTGKLLHTLLHDGEVRSAMFSADGARIVTTSADKTARIWNVDTGHRLATLVHPSSGQALPDLLVDVQADRREEVRSAVFSPDGKLVLTAGDDGTARLWNATTGEPFLEPLQHQGTVRSAVFNLDGGRIVTASDDGTARIWDATTSTSLSPPLEHHGPVRSAAFSPDGSMVVTVSAENGADVWDAHRHCQRRQDGTRLGRGDRQASRGTSRASRQSTKCCVQLRWVSYRHRKRR
jgi:glucose/arabinose dehydrogenase